MRRTVTAFALFATLVAALLVAITPAGAQTGSNCPGGARFCGEQPVPGGGGPGGGAPAPDGGGSTGPIPTSWVAEVVPYPPNPVGCWTVRPAQPGESGTSFEEATATADYWGSAGGPDTATRCPTDAAPDPAQIAADAWRDRVRPPPPTPLRVAPGRAVTGLQAYLEILGGGPQDFTLANPLGPDILIRATPRYVVDWGDGSDTTETRSQGVPWPGGPGEITHVYTLRGQVTITVTAYWTGEWSLAGQPGSGGSLPELPVPTSGSLDLPIDEVQAVNR